MTVGKKIDYVIISTYNQYTFEAIRVVLAKDLVSKQFGKNYFPNEDLNNYVAGDKNIPYRIETVLKGADLLEIRYEQLWQEAPLPLTHPEMLFV